MQSQLERQQHKLSALRKKTKVEVQAFIRRDQDNTDFRGFADSYGGLKADYIFCKSQLSLNLPHLADEPLAAPHRRLNKGMQVCENL